MKALIKDQPAPGVTLKDVPDPELLPGHVIVRVKTCGISGSEVSRYRWARIYHAGQPKDMTSVLPRIMGHEFAGTVAAVASNVHDIAQGARVVVQCVVGCGSCVECDAGLPNHCLRRKMIGNDLDGGFAEFVSVPENCVYAVPDELSLDTAALLQPFAIATYALELSRIKPGDRIGVWGVGQIGISMIQVAQLAGATVEFAVGRDKSRLEAARGIGARHVVSVNDTDAGDFLVRTFGKDRLDAVFEVSGNVLAVTSALSILRKCGKVVVIGNPTGLLQFDLQRAVIDQLNLLTVRAYSLSAWRRALTLICRVQDQQSALPIVRMPLTDGVRAFERAATGEGGAAKFVLEP